MITVPLEMALIAGVLLLVWLGVARGLYVLHPLTRRLAARERELEPITGPDVPVEILPLTRTIDDLFERLRDVLSLQERFIADAAHQLRTPLAGLRLQVDRARASHDPSEVHAALELIDQLVQRTARTSQQLLALTRAQGPWRSRPAGTEMDLAGLVTRAVGLRVPEALRAGIDLLPGAIVAVVDPWRPGSAAGHARQPDRQRPALCRARGACDRQRAGVAGRKRAVAGRGHRPRRACGSTGAFGRTLFRVSGSGAYGTGLGLAIVREVAQQHGALVAFAMADGGGLRISLQFPGATKS
jgi:two-component system sensor histidine kinase TctE